MGVVGDNLLRFPVTFHRSVFLRTYYLFRFPSFFLLPVSSHLTRIIIKEGVFRSMHQRVRACVRAFDVCVCVCVCARARACVRA